MNNFSMFFYVIFLLLIFCNQNTAWAQTMEGLEGFQHIEIEKAIELVDVKKHIKMLIEFKKRFQQDDLFLVTSYSDYFEIIVTHPGLGNSSGGSEQYYLDKKTGESKIGWHEHPMIIPIPEETDITSD